MNTIKKTIAIFSAVMVFMSVSLATIVASNDSYSTSAFSWAYKDNSVSSTRGTYSSSASVYAGYAPGVANCLGGCDTRMVAARSVNLTTTITSNYQHLHRHALIYRSNGELYNMK